MKTSGYKESLDQYADLVNQPTYGDSMGDAFSRAGSQPAQGAAQRSTNALLLGIGAGAKGAANEERRQQLSPMLEQAGRITAKAAELEAQNQQAVQSRANVTKLFQQAAAPLSQLSSASMAGDMPACNALAKGIYTSFRQGLGDPSMGDFDHYHNGTIYYHNSETGVVEGRNIIGLMYQAGINPMEIWGQDAPMIEAGLSPGAKKNYEDSEKMKALEFESKRASTANQYSQANQHNAMANKATQEMNTPKPKYSDSIMTNFTTENSKWVNANREEHRSLKKEIQAYDDIAKYIQAEVGDGFGRAGSGVLAQIQQGLNKANTESEKNQVLIQYATQPLMQGLKRIYTGVTSDKDIALFLQGIPSLEKNPDASIQVAKERAAELRQRLKEDEVTRDVLENDFGYSEPYNSLAVQNRVQERLKQDSSMPQASNTQGFVTMAAPDGSTREVPKDRVKEWENKGASVVK